ncbi:MAG: toprim domain-containing protein [Bacillota bacterium]
MSVWGPGENLTLSQADLAACRPVRGKGGRVLRAFCPFHRSDHQRSLRVDLDSGRFNCFACGAWGYLEEYRRSRQEAPRRPGTGAGMGKRIAPVFYAPTRPLGGSGGHPEGVPEGVACLSEFQAALPGGLGEQYLKRRGVPLEVARACGVGYAGPGKWPHRGRDWRWGRVVFPHTDPEGRVVNLYGRAVGPDEKVPKEHRHDHLPGPRGIFNAQALRQDTVFVCEGVFDALSLMAAGHPNVVAIFGVDGLRWPWFRGVRRLIFALDLDQRGREAWRELAWNAVLRGKEVFTVPELVYAGCKDLNEAWMKAGRLEVSEPEPLKVAENESSGAPAPEPAPAVATGHARGPQADGEPGPTDVAAPAEAAQAHGRFDVRWAREKGWLVVRDPEGREYEIPVRDAPREWLDLASRRRGKG